MFTLFLGIKSAVGCIDGYKQVLFRPMGQEEKRKRLASDAGPFNALHMAEVWGSEVKRAAIEQDGSSAFVYFPQSASIGTAFAVFQQILMQVDMSELQYAVLGDDEFLVHGFSE